MKVSIVTEGGKAIGFGHITRCMSLCHAFEEKGAIVEFMINGDATIKFLLKNKKYKIFNWLEKQDELFDTVKGSGIVVVDSYLAGHDFYRKISKITKTPVYIDDNKRIDYPEGILLNGNIYAKALGYLKKKGFACLLGPEYALLRREFWDVPQKKISKNISNILITFGGEDMRNMTPKVVKLFSDKYGDLNKNIIIGKGFANYKEIKKLSGKGIVFVRNPGAEQMKKMMLDSDVAITAGGQTLHELLSVGIPAIVIAVAANQMSNALAWQARGVIEYAGWWKDKCLTEKISACFGHLKEKAIRIKRSLSGKKIIDGKGSKRVIRQLLSI